MMNDNIKIASRYYDEKIETHGTTPKGVDWNSVQAQEVRFEQVLKVLPENDDSEFSINDIGCGYGSLIDSLNSRYTGSNVTYTGYDISAKMISDARESFNHEDNASFRHITSMDELSLADYSVASGIFNIKQNTSNESWLEYVLDTLGHINSTSRKGFSFNMLTAYSDIDRMQEGLYYGDCCFIFDYCKKNFSRNVALLHDYDIYDFTILIKK